jgi:glycosyltransferase involved in cell wall biosynthesis
MKIAYFTDTFSPEINGVTNTFDHLTAYLRKQGHDYLVFAPDYGVPGRAHEERVLRFKGVSPHVNPNSRLALPSHRVVRDALVKFAPDLVHITIELGIGLAGLRAARELGLPIVMSYHNNFDSYFDLYKISGLEKGYWSYMRWFHSFAQKNLCPSMDTRKILERHDIQNLGIWSRGIDTAAFSPAFRSADTRQALGGKNKTVFLFVSRIAREKGLDVLGEAIRKVNTEHESEALFVFTGDGPYKKTLEDMALPNAVFTGFLKGRALAEMYASADAFVFPSGTETFGNVVLEAMASGLPILCSDTGGQTDFTRHLDNAWVCKYGDADSLARGIAALLLDPGLRRRLGTRSLLNARARTWDSVFSELIDEYGLVLSGPAALKRLA